MESIKLLDGTEWPLNTAYNGDCLEFMRNLPDKCIDLVLTDPPYGINAGRGTEIIIKNDKWKSVKENTKTILGEWDKDRPSKEIFHEIFRVSKHQIIWGGNYFSDFLPASSCWIVWDKLNGKSFFADGELAYTSFNKKLEIFKHLSCGFMGSHKNKAEKIHPTMKPIKLFKWCLGKYAPDNAIVFDPFLGSFTTAVACHSYGLNWLGCEKDEDYFKAGLHRYNMEKEQILMEFDV